MRSARLAATGFGLAASLLLLAACAPAQSLPPGPTTEEIRAIVALENANRWQSLYPGQPQPDVQPIAYLTADEAEAARNQCLLEAGIPNINKAYERLDFDLSVFERVQRRNFVCSVEYQVEVTDPEQLGYLSPSQLEYLYDYLIERTEPCLKLLGYRVPTAPNRDLFVSSYYVGPAWSPYSLISGISPEQRLGIDVRCPPPPIGQDYHA